MKYDHAKLDSMVKRPGNLYVVWSDCDGALDSLPDTCDFIGILLAISWDD
jgi:hypothetical protein